MGRDLGTWQGRGMTSERIYVGSYTSQAGGGDGIAFGTTEALTVVAETVDPSFLTRSADGRFLYATNELEAGRVSAFAIEADGGLKFLNDQPTEGAHPCHLATDPSGRFLLSANYSSGSVAIHPIAADGSLGTATQIVQREGTGPNEDRQEGPHAHQMAFDPATSISARTWCMSPRSRPKAGWRRSGGFRCIRGPGRGTSCSGRAAARRTSSMSWIRR